MRSKTIREVSILKVPARLLTVLFLLLLAPRMPAQSTYARGFQNIPNTRILFVFDASFSMFGQWQSGVKMDIAKTMLSNFLDSLKGIPNLEIGLRCYGHQYYLTPQRNCQDTKLEVPIGKSASTIPMIKEKLKSIVPRGTTPIAYSLEQCGNDFPDTRTRNIIILITDGIEECDGDPCAVSLALQAKGVILKPFIIGVGLGPEIETLGCIGKYYDVSNESNFTNVLNIVVSQALNSTTAQVNLLSQSGQPNETDVEMTFYDDQSGAIRYNYMHTMNNRGVPDTIILDPISTYHLVVHTIPPVEKSGITITPGKHNVIALDAPQGFLNIQVNGVSNYPQLQAIVRKHGDMKTLNVQTLGQTTKYITGKYDLEILTLPRTYLENVDISQSKTTNITLPQAGMVSIFKPTDGPGQIMLEDKNKLTWVCNLNDKALQENIVLQPGNYRVYFRSSAAHLTMYTIERKFKIDSGGSVRVTMY